MNNVKALKTVLLIAAAVSIAALLFTRIEALRYVCLAIMMLFFAINATQDYKSDKKRFSLFLAILCYIVCLLQLVLFAGTLLGLE